MLASASVIDDWCYVSKHIEDVQVSAKRYSETEQSPILSKTTSFKFDYLQHRYLDGTSLLKGSKVLISNQIQRQSIYYLLATMAPTILSKRIHYELIIFLYSSQNISSKKPHLLNSNGFLCYRRCLSRTRSKLIYRLAEYYKVFTLQLIP